MRTVRRLTVLVALLAASLAWAAGTYKTGDEVADVALQMADGKDVKLSSHEGRVVVLFFYGLWQRRSPDDAKTVDAIRKARAKQKLDVVGVAREAKPADAKKFGEDHKLGFPQAVDPKAELYGLFAAKGLPWVAVLDGKRVLKYTSAGVDEDAIEQALVALLGARDPPPEKRPADDKPADGGGKK
jgi:peroxiredoxin